MLRLIGCGVPRTLPRQYVGEGNEEGWSTYFETRLQDAGDFITRLRPDGLAETSTQTGPQPLTESRILHA